MRWQRRADLRPKKGLLTKRVKVFLNSGLAMAPLRKLTLRQLIKKIRV
jgi:hypothetical protein